MKNKDIISLAQCGVLTVTAHDLSVSHAYKVYKLKKTIEAKVKDIQEKEKELLTKIGIKDPQEFDKERAELRKVESRTAEQDERLDEMNKQAEAYRRSQEELLNQDNEIVLKKLPYEEWKKLQDENHKDGKDILSGFAEVALEGVFWTPPVEDEIDE